MQTAFSAMLVAFSDLLVDSRKGARRALVITPTAHRRIGRERLQQLRADPDESTVETDLVGRVRASADPYRVVIFRGRNDDDTGSWGFERGLDAPEAHELARLLVVSHLPTHRCLVSHGAYVMVHTDLRPEEAELLRQVSKELYDERHTEAPTERREAAIHAADMWILRHLNFYFSLRFEKVLESVLPDKLPLIETRAEHTASLVEALRGLESARE